MKQNKFPHLTLYNGKILDCNKRSVSPVNGIVDIEIEPGIFKKFIFEKLLQYLENNGNVKNKKYQSKGTVGQHRRKPVIVTTPDKKEIRFSSCTQAALELKICRTNIPHVLSGRYSQINGYKIKYA